MSDIAISNQLPPRATASSRVPRKWSTLGGRCTSTSTTVIPTNDSDFNETSSKTNGHHRHSSSLFRKASTISRTNGTTGTSEDVPNQSLKKSRSLMNVLRSKLNSPAVIRRFRSKSRESSKQTVTEINGHTTNEQQVIKPSNDEQTTARKSRKRDPSPMRRLANRISQLTRHQRATSNERQKKSPSKSLISDSHDEIKKSPSTTTTTHNKDEVDHINACYDEIRAKFYNNNNNLQRNTSTDDTYNRSLSTISMNGSLLSNDFFNNSQRITSPLPPDDPLLQARKQTNIKLNCLLSGYTLTTSFANHEKSYGQNDLFKFNHYYDVGKRKYDWNFTNSNNRVFSSMRARPMSKSIDSFRPPSVKEHEVPIMLEKIHIADNDRLVQAENHQAVPKPLPDDNELVRYEQNTSTVDVTTPSVPITSTNLHENHTIANGRAVEDHDEEFERNFLRAVDRALGVVNKNEGEFVEPVYDIPKEDEEDNTAHMNLIQMTERALSSINNLPDFTNDNQTNELTDNGVEEIREKVVDPMDELPTNEQSPISIAESNNSDVIDEDISSVLNDLLEKTEDLLLEQSKNGQTFLVKLDEEEKTIKLKADSYNELLRLDDNRLTEDVRTDINAIVGEVNLLLRGKLKQFRGLCQANVTKSSAGEPIPLDSDLEGFWDITYPLIDKVKEKFAKLDSRKAKQWAPIEEYDPNDINNRPRVIDDRLKQLQPQQNKSSKIPTTKSANDNLKKLIQERRKAAATTTHQNHDIEIFVAPK